MVTMIISLLLLLILPAGLSVLGENVDLSCDWETGKGRLQERQPPRRRPATNITECKEQCTKHYANRICIGVNFVPINVDVETMGICEHIFEPPDITLSNENYLDKDWYYFIRPICEASKTRHCDLQCDLEYNDAVGHWLPWTTISVPLSEPSYVTNTTDLPDCMSVCLKYTGNPYECTSIVKDTTSKKCELYNSTTPDAQESGETVLHHKKPSWYLGNSSAATKANITDLGSLKVDGLITFYHIRIPVSGYLIGLQYYISQPNSAGHCNLSFVEMHRQGPGFYETNGVLDLIKPRYYRRNRAVYQYEVNSNIRLEKDDFLALSDYDSQNPNCSHLVSIKSGVNGSYEMALRAFLSEYLALKSAPVPHHDNSLREGQVWISLPPPLTSEGSVVVAGYRIVCSRDANLTSKVNCYDHLLSVDTKEVLLVIPDPSVPYYAAVQVVRNFKGEEQLDLKYSPSVLFCTGRELGETVKIEVLNRTVKSMGLRVVIQVMLTKSFAEDRCAKSLKLNFTDYDSGYKPLNTTSFVLVIEPEVKYNLSLYLQQIDESEVLAWRDTQIFPTTPPHYLACDWTNGTGRLYSLVSNLTTYSTTDFQHCKTLCIGRYPLGAPFLCTAFNYRTSDKRCEILVEPREATRLEQSNDWNYYVRPLCEGNWLPWTTASTSVLEPLLITTKHMLEDCMSACLTHTESHYECKSIVKDATSDKCTLYGSKTTQVSERNTTATNALYFNKPSWYTGTSSAATKANVTNLGSLKFPYEKSAIFFHHIKISTPGYLLGWQYYISDLPTNSIHCNRSFVEIQRHVVNEIYTGIEVLRLNPKNESLGGRRFQYDAYSNARLEKDDFLVVTASDKNPECIHLASMATGVNGRYNVALRVFVSEYLALKSAPVRHHDNSLREGQVWISLPPPLTSEDSVVVAGYRIVCSRDANLTSKVNCYDHLLSVDTKEVLLVVPDPSVPYYAAVQIVRNFKGEEQLDLKHSPTVLFCAVRQRNKTVTIDESFDNATWMVNVKVNLLLFSDQCAKGVRMRYNGIPYSDYAFLHPVSQHVYTLKLNPGTSYYIELELQLLDSSTIILWESGERITTDFTKLEASTVSGATRRISANESSEQVPSTNNINIINEFRNTSIEELINIINCAVSNRICYEIISTLLLIPLLYNLF